MKQDLGLSPLLATLILIAITFAVGLSLYTMTRGWGTKFAGAEVMVSDASIVVTQATTVVTVTLKNIGDVPLENVKARIYGEGGAALELQFGSLAVGQSLSKEAVNPSGITFRPGQSYAGLVTASSAKGSLSRSFTILVSS
ncbi:MAG: archaellin/type IV pilin N-terminal domain-containing protein [Candidatus Hadarchaeales archaeon]